MPRPPAGSMNRSSPSNSRREANGDQARKIAVKQKKSVPRIPIMKTWAPQEMPTASAQKRKMMSRGSRIGVRKRTKAMAPRMPRPRAMLFPMAMIMMQMTMVARTIV